VIVNGWTLFAHPLFFEQVEKLTTAVEKAKSKDPEGFKSSDNAKVLAAIEKLIFETIPYDPTLKIYRQGESLGKEHKHWFCAKFAKKRFRLFFRYDAKAKIIIYAWVNDSETLRTYSSKTDAYAVFRSMLNKACPPSKWDVLFKEVQEINLVLRRAKP